MSGVRYRPTWGSAELLHEIPDSISIRPRQLPSTSCPIHSPIANGFDSLTKLMSAILIHRSLSPEHYMEAVRVTSSHNNSHCRPQWPHGLKRKSAGARLWRLPVQITPGALKPVSFEFSALSGRGLCVRPHHSSRGVLPSVVRLSVIVKPR